MAGHSKREFQALYQQRVKRYARNGGAAMLWIGLCAVSWSYSGVALWAPLWLGLPTWFYLLVAISAGVAGLAKARGDLRCPVCSAVLPRVRKEGCICPECETTFGLGL